MRDVLAAWGRLRWPGCRIGHELVLGERRIDMVFICDKDLIGFEIKSSVDKLDRLDEQMKEYRRYLPEVWVAAAPTWKHDVPYRNLALVSKVDGVIEPVAPPPYKKWKPQRDELVCSRMLELLWRSEAARIAQRTGVIPGTNPTGSTPRWMILPMLVRLLTGNEIMREVCYELQHRPRMGFLSDKPLEEL